MRGRRTDDPHRYYIGARKIDICVTPGIKVWSNGMPLKGDTYKSCTNRCTYCFARNLTAAFVERGGVRYDPRIARTMDLKQVASYFEKAFQGGPGLVLWAIRNRQYLELGTMCEIFQDEEAKLGVTWTFLQLCRQARLPLLINTKGNLLVRNERYLRLLLEYPAPVIASITLTGINDRRSRGFEPFAPDASERLELIRTLRDHGIPTVAYCAPYLPGVTDQPLEEYIATLIDAGAIGVHLRNLYITGKLGAETRWRRFYDEHKEHIVRNGAGWKLSGSYLADVYLRMQEIADELDPRFRVVGIKSHWFDLNPYHGKAALDWLPDAFHEGIVDWTAVPILRKIRERLDDPQLLEWERVGFSPDLVRHPERVPLRGGPVSHESTYLRTGCYRTVGGAYSTTGERWMDGWDWIKSSLWGGLTPDPDIRPNRPAGFLSTVKRIYPVSSNGSFARSSSGEFLYAYVPPAMEDELVHDGAVREEDAAGFHAPDRDAGADDKFYKVPIEDRYRLGDRWTS